MVFKKGHKVSEETRKKISKANFGKKHTEETKKKMSEIHKKNLHSANFKKGFTPWNNGLKGKGICKPNRGSFKKGLKTWNTGLTKETDRRIKDCWNKGLTKETNESLRRSGENGKRTRGSKKWKATIGKERIRKIKVARARQVFPVKDSSIEVKIQGFLKALGIRFFTHQYMKEIEHGYQCDIFIPSMNLILECDGDYWHEYPTGRAIDHVRTKELMEKGFKVLRLWEHEIRKMNLEEFEITIKERGKQ